MSSSRRTRTPPAAPTVAEEAEAIPTAEESDSSSTSTESTPPPESCSKEQSTAATPAAPRNVIPAVVDVDLEAEEPPTLKLVPSPSSVNPWPRVEPYFEFKLRTLDSLSYRCKLCLHKAHVIRCGRSSKSNLKRHYLSMHGGDEDEWVREVEAAATPRSTRHLEDCDELSVMSVTGPRKRLKQTHIPGAFSPRQGRPAKYTQEEFDADLRDVVIDNMLPFCTVENATFLRFMKRCQPTKTVVSRRTLMKRIDSSYTQMKAALVAQLKNVPSVGTTCDLWSAHNRSFVGVTCHWIDDSLERRSASLTCRRFSGSHTYDRLASVLFDIHQEFEIEDKVVMTTTDNASNFVKAFKEFVGVRAKKSRGAAEESEDADVGPPPADEAEIDADEDITVVNIDELLDEVPEEERSPHLPPHQRCAAHTLNLVATTDCERAMGNLPNDRGSAKLLYRSALATLKGLWNKYTRSTHVSPFIATLKNKTKCPKTYRAFCSCVCCSVFCL